MDNIELLKELRQKIRKRKYISKFSDKYMNDYSDEEDNLIISHGGTEHIICNKYKGLYQYIENETCDVCLIRGLPPIRAIIYTINLLEEQPGTT